MRSVFLFLSYFFSLHLSTFSQGMIIESFDQISADSNYWNIFIPENADTNIGFINFNFDSLNFIQGNAAINIDWSIHNNNDWGGLTRLEHFTQDENLYDFSGYDSISFWFYNRKATSTQSAEFHLLLYDASHSDSDIYSSENTENYYSFHHILDVPTGWQKITMPIKADEYFWEGEGFNLTGWSGIIGNAFLDKDKIAGFGFEFAFFQESDSLSISGNILLDNFVLIRNFRPPYFFVIPDSSHYRNLILWDNFGPENCVYNIYYSKSRITQENIYTSDVEVLEFNIPRTLNHFDHDLIYPLIDTEIELNYLLTYSENGIESLPDNNQTVINKAKGSPVISFKEHFNFYPDGNLDEWKDIIPFQMYVSDNSGTVVEGTIVSDDSDLSADIFLVCSSENLFIAFVVTDDSIFTSGENNPWDKDSPELYIGLYDWHQRSHENLKRGLQPDYHFNFGESGLREYQMDTLLTLNHTDNFIWKVDSESRYIVEAKITFEQLAKIGHDTLFVPSNKCRIPIDISINDAETNSGREGILAYSKYNEDKSWEDVSRWSYTWIWTDLTDIKNKEIISDNFHLKQNYPNPFNSSTTIKYSLAKKQFVTFKIFDIMGKEIATLVNKVQGKGNYSIDFDASNLASGVYLYKLQAGQFVSAQKMILMK